MKCPVRTLTPLSTVAEIKAALGVPYVHSFPIINAEEKLIGIVSREILMVLVGGKVWIERDANSKLDLEAIQTVQNKATVNMQKEQFQSIKGKLSI